MSAGKYREILYCHDHEKVASLNVYSLRIVGMSDLGLSILNKLGYLVFAYAKMYIAMFSIITY